MDTPHAFAARRRAPASRLRSTATPLPLEIAFRRLLQRRLLLVSCLFIAVLVGIAAVQLLRNNRYTYEGVLLYTPNSVTAPYYTPPALQSLLHSVESPTLLAKLQRTYDLKSPSTSKRMLRSARSLPWMNQLGDYVDLEDAPTSLLEMQRNVLFELGPYGDTIVARAVRSDQAETETVLNAAMAYVVEDVRALRKQALETFVSEFGELAA